MKRQDFAEKVIEIVLLIPEGRVSTYGAIAKFIGTGGSARTVGWVLRHSIEGKTIPAHRVVNASGLLSGAHAFSQDNPMETRLKNEGVFIKNQKVLNFKTVFWDPSTEL